jgi:hypothetical protein
MLKWPRIGDDRLRDYLAAVDKRFDPTLRRILLESRSKDAIVILADVFGRRRNKDDIPILLDALAADRGGEVHFSVVRITETLAQFGDDIIPILETRWGALESDEVKNLYAITCLYIGSERSEETVREWVARTQDEAKRLKQNGIGGYESKMELLNALKIHLREIRAAREKTGKREAQP